MNMIQDTIPWYKQPLVWMLIAIPASAVLMGVVVIYYAITTDDGLVAEDYYKKGLTINRQLAKEEFAQRLQLSAVINVEAETGFIRVSFDKGLMSELPSRLQLALKHATKQQNDVFVVLQKGIDNNYVGSIAHGVHQGIWHIELSNTGDEKDTQWRLARRVNIESTTTVMMQTQ